MEASRQLGPVEEEASAGVLKSETVIENFAMLQPPFDEKTSEAIGHAGTATSATQNATTLRLEAMSDATAQHHPHACGAIPEMHRRPNPEGVRNRPAGISQVVKGAEESGIEVEAEVEDCS
jgi:hypothetical protein